jgi:hypothetical protein
VIFPRNEVGGIWNANDPKGDKWNRPNSYQPKISADLAAASLSASLGSLTP